MATKKKPTKQEQIQDELLIFLKESNAYFKEIKPLIKAFKPLMEAALPLLMQELVKQSKATAEYGSKEMATGENNQS